MTGPWEDFQAPNATSERPPWEDFAAPATMGEQAKQTVRDVLGQTVDALKAPVTGPVGFAQALRQDPAAIQEKVGPWLPAAGAAIGSVFAPGVGTAAGAGLGQMAKQAGDIAFGTPQAITPGQTFSSRAGIEAAGQALTAGAGEVNSLVKAAPNAAPYAQRGIEAAGKFLAPVGQGIKRGIGRVQQAFTGAPARNAVQLMDNPETLVTTIGQVGSQGRAVQTAEAGLENKLSAESMAKITTNQHGFADKIVTDLMEVSKTAPEAITTEDAIMGIKAIDRTIPAPTRNNAGVLQKYYDLRSHLAEIVAKNEPGYAAAKQGFSEAKAASQFRNILPRTTTGNISTVKTVLPMFLDWKRVFALPVTSPAVWGTGMAAGSAAAKAAGFALTNPTARQALISRYIASRQQ